MKKKKTQHGLGDEVLKTLKSSPCVAPVALFETPTNLIKSDLKAGRTIEMNTNAVML